MLDGHCADILENQVAPGFVAWVLVAAVAVRISFEEGFTVRGEGDETAWG